MHLVRSLPLGALFVVAISLAAPAQAQPDTTRELLHRLEVEGGDSGDQAAFELFNSGEHDARLRAILTNRSGTGKKEARLCLLRALKFSDRSRRLAACSLVQEALDDPAPDVQAQAIATFATLEGEVTYEYISQALARLRWAPPETAGGKQAAALIEVLERLRNPQRAIRALIEVLTGRLHRDLERRVRQTLERLTARRYASPSEWRAWWARVEGLSLSEFRREVAQERTRLVRRIEGTAEDLYARLLAARHDQPDLLLAELKRGLADETVPAVARRAVHELGRLAQLNDHPHPVREPALTALRDRLKQSGSPDYNELKAHVLLALGRTGDPAVLPDLLEYLVHNAPRMRAAAATALGSLGDARAVTPLLQQLDHEDPELVEAVIVALGDIRQNPPVQGTRDGSAGLSVSDAPLPVSDVLVRFADVLLQRGGAAGPTATTHLARLCEALGKLPYPDQAAQGRAVGLLLRLAAYPADPNVRNSAVTALGPLRHPDVFPLLVQRLDQEPEAHVRKAVLDAIGRQGVDDPQLAPQAVARLVPFLFSTSEQEAALRRKSQQRLEELSRGEGFLGLEMVVDTLLDSYEDRAAHQAALSFLLLLPAPDALGDVDEASRARYHRLVWRRADCYLRSGDPVSALRDFEAAQSGLKLHTLDAIDEACLPLFLGKGQALLALDPPRPAAAFAQLEACLRHVAGRETPDAERLARVAALALDALEGVRASEPERVAELAARLEKTLSGAAPELRQRLLAIQEGGTQ